METNAFLTLFEKALIQNGFTKEAAHYHTLKVSKSLSHDDKAKIYNIYLCYIRYRDNDNRQRH